MWASRVEEGLCLVDGEGMGACLAACHGGEEDTSRVRELWREKHLHTAVQEDWLQRSSELVPEHRKKLEVEL